MHQISPNDYDSIKRCSNKDLVDANFSDLGSKLLNDSQGFVQKTTSTAESALDKLLLSDDDIADFDLDTRKRNNTLPTSTDMKRPAIFSPMLDEL